VSRPFLQPTLIDVGQMSKIRAGKNILFQGLFTALSPLEISKAPKIEI
jgi:hypothetical protein